MYRHFDVMEIFFCIVKFGGKLWYRPENRKLKDPI
jgi:hypothetical protein